MTRRDAPVALLREALSRFGQVEIRARGGSMAPWVPDGSRCAVAPGTPRWLDLVALTYGETLVVHRVWRVVPLRTRGDAGRRWDPPAGELLGVVFRVDRPSGRAYRPTRLAWRLAGGATAILRWAASRAAHRA